MLMPKRVKHRKVQRGRMTGAASRGNKVVSPWVGEISWRRKWLPTPVFLPGESHGCRSLVGYDQ